MNKLSDIVALQGNVRATKKNHLRFSLAILRIENVSRLRSSRYRSSTDLPLGFAIVVREKEYSGDALNKASKRLSKVKELHAARVKRVVSTAGEEKSILRSVENRYVASRRLTASSETRLTSDRRLIRVLESFFTEYHVQTSSLQLRLQQKRPSCIIARTQTEK